MLATIATLVFAPLVSATAACTATAVIGTSLRDALPALRRLAADRRALADDRVYLYTLIETPRHDGTPAPVVAAPAVQDVARPVMINPLRRRPAALPIAPAPLRAAA